MSHLGHISLNHPINPNPFKKVMFYESFLPSKRFPTKPSIGELFREFKMTVNLY